MRVPPPATPGLAPVVTGTIRMETSPNTDDLDALVARTLIVPPPGHRVGRGQEAGGPDVTAGGGPANPARRGSARAAVSRTLAPAGRRAGAPEIVTKGRVSVRATEAMGGLRGKPELAEIATYWKPSGPR